MIFRKPHDPNDPFGVQSGGALNSAVDGMSFAHDIVMCTDPVVRVTSTASSSTSTTTTAVVSTTGSAALTKCTAIASMKTITKTGANAKNSSNPETGAINSMLSQIHGTQSLPTTQPVPLNGIQSSTTAASVITATAITPAAAAMAALHAQESQQRDYKDPLRELVLISEAICINDKDNAYLTNVNTLAKEATVLEHVKEVLPEQAGQMHLSPAPLGGHHPVTKTGEVPTTLNLFQDPKDMVDPVKEKAFLKKLEALEEGDSEGFDG